MVADDADQMSDADTVNNLMVNVLTISARELKIMIVRVTVIGRV
jgi:hypothetical protein